MRFVKQPYDLPIVNCDNYLDQTDNAKRHGLLLPSTLRAGVCGPSGSGKTNILLCLLTHENGLRFINLYIYSKSLRQSKYRYLFEVFKPLKDINLFIYDDHKEVIKPNEAGRNSVMVFDDIACSPQSIICEYFANGRHFDIDCFYLCQTYSKIPKQLVRDNFNFLILFKQDQTNLKHIYSDHVNTDMSFHKFTEMCSACWKDRYGFVVIDKEKDLDKGRYRYTIDTFIIP